MDEALHLITGNFIGYQVMGLRKHQKVQSDNYRAQDSEVDGLLEQASKEFNRFTKYNPDFDLKLLYLSKAIDSASAAINSAGQNLDNLKSVQK